MRVLLVLNMYLKSIVDDLKRQSVHLKVVYYGGRLFDDVGIKDWCEWADVVLAEDRIIDVVGQGLETAVWPASRYREAIGEAETRRTFPAAGATPGQPAPGEPVPPSSPVLFCAGNDTHVMTFRDVAKRIKNYKFVIMYPERRLENAAAALRSIGEEAEVYEQGFIKRLRPSAVVFGNDWAPQDQLAIKEAKALDIPTICIQEGCLEWRDPRARRMERCHFPFVQGPITLQYLDRELYFITGNPRFDAIGNLPLPKKPTVMINCNFPYGIFVEWRDRWIGDVVKACEQAGLDFFIARHPRDPSEPLGLPIRPSSALNVHEHIAQSSLLVTRFSTLVYEAALMGRSVVYYNPHGETMQLYNNDETGGITKVYSPDKLSEAITSTLRNADENRTNREDFLRLHCGSLDGRAAERCAIAISDVAAWHGAHHSFHHFSVPEPLHERLNSLFGFSRVSTALRKRYLPRITNRR